MTPTFGLHGVHAHTTLIQSLPGEAPGITGVNSAQRYRLERMLRASGFTVPDRRLIVPANLPRGADLALLVELLVTSEQITPPPPEIAFFGGVTVTGELFSVRGAVAAAAALTAGFLLTAPESADRIERAVPGRARALAHLRDLRGVPVYTRPCSGVVRALSPWVPTPPILVDTHPGVSALQTLMDPLGDSDPLLWQVQDALFLSDLPIRPRVCQVFPGDLEDRYLLLQAIANAYRGVLVLQDVDRIPLERLRHVIQLCLPGWFSEHDPQADTTARWPAFTQVVGVPTHPTPAPLLSPEIRALFPGRLPAPSEAPHATHA